MNTPVHYAAVLLAAGSGSRMGHKPNSLLELNGEPLIRRNARQLLEAGVRRALTGRRPDPARCLPLQR
jgi:choline kinase